MIINPTVKTCYDKLGITIEQVGDIKISPDYDFKVIDTCVYHIPKNYKPQDFIFAVDLDNTLTYHEKSLYPQKEDDIKLLPNRYKVLQEIFKKGYTIVVFTNQSTMKKETAIVRMQNFLKQVNLPIYVFVSLKKDNYRKPEIGMWNLFLKITKITVRNFFFTGDALGREFDFADSDKVFAENIISELKETGISNTISTGISNPEEVFGSFDSSLIPKKNREVVLFVGAPGSNKSTLYREKYSDYVHISKDIQKNREMTEFKKALKEGKNIVVDDTNPTLVIRNSFADLARKENYSICILYFVKAGHNYNDKRAKKVPDVVYHVFFKKLEPPTETEGKVYLVY